MKEIASRGFFCTNLRSSEPATPLRDRGARNPLTLGLTGPRLLLRPCHPVSKEKGGACLFTTEEVAQTKMSRASDWDPLSLPHCGSRPRLDGLRVRLACRARDSGNTLARRLSLGYLAPPGVCFANCSRMRRLGPVFSRGSRDLTTENQVLYQGRFTCGLVVVQLVRSPPGPHPRPPPLPRM